MLLVVENSILFFVCFFVIVKIHWRRGWYFMTSPGSFPFAGKNLHFSILMWDYCARTTETGVHASCVCVCVRLWTVWCCQCQRLHFDTSCPDGRSLIRSIMFPAWLSCVDLCCFLPELFFSQHISHFLLLFLFSFHPSFLCVSFSFFFYLLVVFLIFGWFSSHGGLQVISWD